MFTTEKMNIPGLQSNSRNARQRQQAAETVAFSNHLNVQCNPHRLESTPKDGLFLPEDSPCNNVFLLSTRRGVQRGGAEKIETRIRVENYCERLFIDKRLSVYTCPIPAYKTGETRALVTLKTKMCQSACRGLIRERRSGTRQNVFLNFIGLQTRYQHLKKR